MNFKDYNKLKKKLTKLISNWEKWHKVYIKKVDFDFFIDYLNKKINKKLKNKDIWYLIKKTPKNFDNHFLIEDGFFDTYSFFSRKNYALKKYILQENLVKKKIREDKSYNVINEKSINFLKKLLNKKKTNLVNDLTLWMNLENLVKKNLKMSKNFDYKTVFNKKRNLILKRWSEKKILKKKKNWDSFIKERYSDYFLSYNNYLVKRWLVKGIKRSWIFLLKQRIYHLLLQNYEKFHSLYLFNESLLDSNIKKKKIYNFIDKDTEKFIKKRVWKKNENKNFSILKGNFNLLKKQQRIDLMYNASFFFFDKLLYILEKKNWVVVLKRKKHIVKFLKKISLKKEKKKNFYKWNSFKKDILNYIQDYRKKIKKNVDFLQSTIRINYRLENLLYNSFLKMQEIFKFFFKRVSYTTKESNLITFYFILKNYFKIKIETAYEKKVKYNFKKFFIKQQYFLYKKRYLDFKKDLEKENDKNIDFLLKDVMLEINKEELKFLNNYVIKVENINNFLNVFLKKSIFRDGFFLFINENRQKSYNLIQKKQIFKNIEGKQELIKKREIYKKNKWNNFLKKEDIYLSRKRFKVKLVYDDSIFTKDFLKQYFINEDILKEKVDTIINNRFSYFIKKVYFKSSIFYKVWWKKRKLHLEKWNFLNNNYNLKELDHIFIKKNKLSRELLFYKVWKPELSFVEIKHINFIENYIANGLIKGISRESSWYRWWYITRNLWNINTAFVPFLQKKKDKKFNFLSFWRFFFYNYDKFEIKNKIFFVKDIFCNLYFFCIVFLKLVKKKTMYKIKKIIDIDNLWNIGDQLKKQKLNILKTNKKKFLSKKKIIVKLLIKIQKGKKKQYRKVKVSISVFFFFKEVLYYILLFFFNWKWNIDLKKNINYNFYKNNLKILKKAIQKKYLIIKANFNEKQIFEYVYLNLDKYIKDDVFFFFLKQIFIYLYNIKTKNWYLYKKIYILIMNLFNIKFENFLKLKYKDEMFENLLKWYNIDFVRFFNVYFFILKKKKIKYLDKAKDIKSIDLYESSLFLDKDQKVNERNWKNNKRRYVDDYILNSYLNLIFFFWLKFLKKKPKKNYVKLLNIKEGKKFDFRVYIFLLKNNELRINWELILSFLESLNIIKNLDKKDQIIINIRVDLLKWNWIEIYEYFYTLYMDITLLNLELLTKIEYNNIFFFIRNCCFLTIQMKIQKEKNHLITLKNFKKLFFFKKKNFKMLKNLKKFVGKSKKKKKLFYKFLNNLSLIKKNTDVFFKKRKSKNIFKKKDWKQFKENILMKRNLVNLKSKFTKKRTWKEFLKLRNYQYKTYKYKVTFKKSWKEVVKKNRDIFLILLKEEFSKKRMSHTDFQNFFEFWRLNLERIERKLDKRFKKKKYITLIDNKIYWENFFTIK